MCQGPQDHPQVRGSPHPGRTHRIQPTVVLSAVIYCSRGRVCTGKACGGHHPQELGAGFQESSPCAVTVRGRMLPVRGLMSHSVSAVFLGGWSPRCHLSSTYQNSRISRKFQNQRESRSYKPYCALHNPSRPSESASQGAERLEPSQYPGSQGQPRAGLVCRPF